MFNLKIRLRADPDRIEYRILLREIRLFVIILLVGLRPLQMIDGFISDEQITNFPSAANGTLTTDGWMHPDLIGTRM